MANLVTPRIGSLRLASQSAANAGHECSTSLTACMVWITMLGWREQCARLSQTALRTLFVRRVAEESNVVLRAMPVVGQLQILWRVVQFIAITMMNLFVAGEWATEETFHHRAVFQHFGPSAFAPNFAIAVWPNVSATTGVGAHG